MSTPILVTGAHRSGTTWVGAMLALSPRVGLIHEPFNPTTSPGVSGAPFERFFQYVCVENEGPFVSNMARTVRFSYDLRRQLPTIRSPKALGRTLRELASFTQSRVTHARPLLKDPIAVFSSEWIAERFGAQVLVVVRHPAAFVSSLTRLGWTHDFGSFLAQPLLMRDHLGPFEGEIRDFATHERDGLDQAILLWRVIYASVATFRERHPNWTFVRHEDLSRDPPSGFASMYATFGLPFDEGIRRSIVEHTGEDNPDELRSSHDVRLNSRANVDSWRRRLSSAEIERVRTGVADIAPLFYDDEDW